jgi:uncharacterized protein (TIGR00730 family)
MSAGQTPTEIKRSVCVYCGSSSGTGPEYAAEAVALGQELVNQNLGLVYGGGRVGLMGLVADSVLDHGGRVHGIIPEHLVRAETAHKGLTTLETVATMHERKARMEELAVGFIVLPGGFGTFDEVFEILTWNQLGLISKPVVFLDGTGYYAPLFDAFDHMIAAGFVKENYRALLNRATTVEEAVGIASSPAVAIEGKLIDLDITSKKTITS